jgi:uncharacterized protein YbaR (Trm112 family)
MKKSMLDILACPIDKHYPLELFEINIKKDNENKNDHDNNNIVITEGILFCTKCSRFYPIIEEIPVMLPDELREKQTDIDFLKRWNNKLPEKIIKHGNPWHL